MLTLRAEASAQRWPDQRAQHSFDRCAAAAGVFGGLQFAQALAIGGDTPRHEQLGDQFVLGAEMVIDRGEVDVRCRNDVAQRHVGEAALRVKPLGGVEDCSPGAVGCHG